jgi:hypothetical protein
MTWTVRRPLWPVLWLVLLASVSDGRSATVPSTFTLTRRLTFAAGDARVEPAGAPWPGDVARVVLRGAMPSDVPGEPTIPLVPATVVIPATQRVVSLRAIVESEAVLAEGVRLATAPELSAEGPRPVAPARNWTEGPVAELQRDGYLRGWKLAALLLRPVRYDPATGRLSLVTSVRIELTLAERVDAGPTPLLRERSDVAELVAARIRSTVVNPEDVTPAWRGAESRPVGVAPASFTPSFRPSLDGSPVDYVIVTADSLATAFQAFADWKTSLGQQTVVRTTSWIAANYPGGADQAETIRRFLQDAFMHWGLTYVLLGGDVGVIPYRSGHTQYYGSDDIPADLYYQCLDGNWNADGDSLYGEGYVDSTLAPGDGADLYPEVFIGRVPANTVSDVNVWIAKTEQFAQSAPADFATRVLFASEVLFPSDWKYPPGGPYSLDGAAITETAIRYIPPTLHTARLYQNYIGYAGSIPETKRATIDSLNAGYMFFEHMGHGYRNTLSVGDDVITNPDADALTNAGRAGVVYSVNCNSASFEFNCIAEHFLLNPHGGAIAYVGATRYDFPTTVWDYQNSFFELVFCDTTHYTLGAAASLSKVPYVPYAYLDNSHRWTQMAVTYLGDPGLDVYWRTPRTLQVALSPIVVGQTTVSATVRASGIPVPGVRVTLWKRGEAYASAETDASGNAVVPFTARTAGTVSVAAYSPSDRATITSATVLAASTPYLSAGAPTIQDGVGGQGTGNSDGVINPGETIRVLVPLTNTGGSSATGVTASLTFDDPFKQVAVVDSTSSYGNVPVGGTANGDGFTLTVAGTTPDLRTVRTLLTTRDGEGHVWQSAVVLGVAAPSLAIVGRTLADTIGADNRNGVAEPGETVAYQLTVQNWGSGAASGLIVHVAPADATTRMMDSTQVFASDLAARATDTGGDWTTFQVLSGTTHTFAAWLTDRTGRVLDRRRLDLTAPAQPVNVASAADAASIALVWSAARDTDLYGYNIYRSVTSGGPYSKINSYVDVRTAYYKDENVQTFTRYYYKIAAVDSSGNESVPSPELSSTTNPPLHTGWPIDLDRSTPASVVFANIDNSADSTLDLVTGAAHVFAMHADGTEVRDGDNEAQTLGPFSEDGLYFAATCALDDLDHDGVLEIVAASFNSQTPPYDSTTVYVYNGATGALRTGWPKVIPKFGWSSPACGDIDGNGDDDIVMGSSDGWVYAWHDDGTDVRDGDPMSSVPGRFYNTGALYLYGSPALADLDHDNKPEIVIGGNNGSLYALNEDGTNLPGFPFTFDGAGGISASPAIYLQNGQYLIVYGSIDNSLHCVDQTGTMRWVRYLQEGGTSRTPSPAVGDIDGDGQLDVVVAATNGRLYAMRGDTGAILSGWKDQFGVDGVPFGTGTGGVSESSPVLADIDGDGMVDVLIGAEDGKLYGFRFNGQPAPGFPIVLSGEVRGSPTVWDLDGDGRTEMAYAGWDQMFYLWDLPIAFNPATAPWPMFHHDNRHTGVAGEPVLLRPRVPESPSAVSQPTAPRLAILSHTPWRNQVSFAIHLPANARDTARHVSLRVYDGAGRLACTLLDALRQPGVQIVTWDGRSAAGRVVPSGVYYARLTVDGDVLTRRTVKIP